MEWLTYVSGVITTLIGVLATVLATKSIEEKKRKLESENSLEQLYIELDDIHKACEKEIHALRDCYLKSEKIIKGFCKREDVTTFSLPRPLILVLLQMIPGTRCGHSVKQHFLVHSFQG